MKGSSSDIQLCREVLEFLGEVRIRSETQERGTLSDGPLGNLLMRNFTKVVDDCRLMLRLLDGGFLTQAGIVARSTSDACSLMMHIALAGEDASMVQKWLEGKRATPCTQMERLSEAVGQELDIGPYQRTHSRLVDFIHANCEAVEFDAAQSTGTTEVGRESARPLVYWTGYLDLYLHLYLISCLLVVSLMAPDVGQAAAAYLDQLLDHEGRG